ncbi:MAG: universal stress protein [Bdellovibrionota bacterium]
MKNKNIKNLIVGLDLSSYSRVVAREAEELSAKMKIPLTVLFACPIDWAAPEYQKQLVESLNLKISQMYDLKADATIIVKFGKADEEIIAAAKKLTEPMIMIGHKGYSAILRMFLGSTAEKIAQASPFPVWIHRGYKTVLPKKILIPSDLSDRSDQTVSDVEILAKSFKGKYELYHVWEEPIPLLDYSTWALVYEQLKKDEEKKLKVFKKKHPKVKTSKTAGDVVHNIQEHSKKFDVIAISPSHKKNSFPFFGSVNAQLVRNGEKPILVCP